MSACNVRNRTIFCDDNIDVLSGINADSIDLIYLDPPFNKNKEFIAPIGSSAEGAGFKDIFREDDLKDEWLLTIAEDEPGLFHYLNGIKGVGRPYNFAYLAYMAMRLIECRRVLKRTGSIYLHCDPTMSHYLKTTMDCIFGEEYFKNEIVWKRTSSHSDAKKMGAVHDIILWYIAKDGETRLNSYQTSDPGRSYQLEFQHLTPWFRETERHIHDKFDNRHEWVAGNMAEIIKEIRSYQPA